MASAPWLDISAEVSAEAVVETFEQTPNAVRAKVRAALLDAGRLVQAKAQSTTAFNDVTGRLRESIQYRLAETDRAQTVTIKPSDHVGLFLEGGVVAYVTAGNLRSAVGRKVSKLEKVLRTRKRERLVKEGGWRIEPRRFMRDSFAAVRDRVADMLDEAVAAGLERR